MPKNREIIILFSLLCFAILLVIDDLITQQQVESQDKNIYLDLADVNKIVDENMELIDSQINYYKENYHVTINVHNMQINSDYKLEKINSSEIIIDSLNKLGKYFNILGKEFFINFYKNNMSGLQIYLVNNISNNNKSSKTTDVVGLFLKKNNQYIIVLKVNSNEDIVNIAFHETMHAIEEYLHNFNEYFAKWNYFNPPEFSYSQIFYTKQIFNDTIAGSLNFNDVYFIDNYARSSAMEDRARMFEYLCLDVNINNYPNLMLKAQYLKEILKKYI